MRRVIKSLLFVFLAACGQGQGSGGLEIQTRGEDGKVSFRNELTIDFGAAIPGMRATQMLVLANTGANPLTVEGYEVLSGSVGGEEAAYSVDFAAPLSISAGRTVEVPLHFNPGAEPTHDGVEAVASLRIFAAENQGSVTVTMRGRATGVHCEPPVQALDFGNVARGDTASREFEIRNPSDQPLEVEFSALTGPDSSRAYFAFQNGSPAPEVIAIPAQSSKAFRVRYSPGDVGEHQAMFELTIGACEATPIQLTGTGVEAQLFTDGPLDCGAVPVGSERIIDLNFTNIGANDVTLTELRFNWPENFQLVGLPDPTSLTVPGGETVAVQLRCKPVQPGKLADYLSFKTNLTRQPTGSVAVRVFGGGPRLQVESASLNFGDVPLVAGATSPWSLPLRLKLTNIGTASRASEYLTFPNGLEIVAAGASPSAAAFTATFETADGSTVPSLAPGEFVEVEVRFSPRAIGAHTAQLSFATNEFDAVSTSVSLAGNAFASASCQYELEPSTIDFGRVNFGSLTHRPTSLLNTGTETCWIARAGLEGEGFSSKLAPSAIPVEPGERILVPATLLVSPETAGASRVGKLSLLVSSATPSLEIPLTADIGEDCLFIAPGDFDLGPVTSGCASPTRTVHLYNRCSTDIEVTGIKATSLGGPAGCAAKASCAEFDIPTAHTNRVPTTLAPSASLTFTLRHVPQDQNLDLATLGVTWGPLNGSTSTTTTSTFTARGVPTDSREETLVMRSRADVLFTLDDSGSGMPYVYENEVIPQFERFFAFAEAEAIDWNLGLSTSDLARPLFQGRLQSGEGHPDKVLNRYSPSLQAQWTAKLRVGSLGSPVEATIGGALGAVTPPHAYGANLGFLRDDASLGILAMTNASEQSTPYADAALLIDRLLSVKGFNRPNDVSFSGIVPVEGTSPTMCSYDNGPDDGRFARLIEATNGAFIDVCSPDVDVMMSTFGERTMGRRDLYFLSQVPADPAALELSTASGPLPAQPPGQGVAWSYETASNAIRFTGGHGPRPGDPIQVAYTAACLVP